MPDTCLPTRPGLPIFLILLLLIVPVMAQSAPYANFTANPTSGPAPLSVTFTDISTGNPTGRVWYFGDETYTAPWTRQTPNPGWSAGWWGHSTVALPDGSIVLMTGYNGDSHSEVWRSADNGTLWTLMNVSAGWSARYGHSGVAMPDGTIVMMGGWDGGFKNDTWNSGDGGATWKLMNASSGWSARYGHSSVAMPDGSIVLMGGRDGRFRNDTWRSIDNGAAWVPVNTSSGWTARYLQSSIAMPDGTIVLIGGQDESSACNDLWRFTPAGSSELKPVHRYTTPGTYTVSLQSYNTYGYNSARKTGYIMVKVGVFPLPGYPNPPTDPDHDGIYEDINGNNRLDFADVVLYFNRMEWIAANEPVSAFDLNRNGRIDFADIVRLFGEI